MQIVGVGRIMFWEGGSLWLGLATAPIPAHAHHAIQLTFALNGAVRFRPNDGLWAEYQGVMIPADLFHSFEAVGSVIAHVFVEPESPFGRGLRHRFGAATIKALPEREAQLIGDRIRRLFEDRVPDDELKTAAQDGLCVLTAGIVPTRPNEPRIVRAIAAIKQRLHELDDARRNCRGGSPLSGAVPSPIR